MTQRRAFYRLHYPPSMRPQLCCRDQTFDVVELSEQGLRVALKSATGFPEGTPVAGILRFEDGGLHLVDGTTLRVEADEMIVTLSAAVSLSRMLEEQRRIRRFACRDEREETVQSLFSKVDSTQSRKGAETQSSF